MSPARGGEPLRFDAPWAAFAKEASPLILLALRSEAPHRTGDYRNTIRILTNGKRIMAVSRAKPGRFILEGTKRHFITPVHAQALHFTAKNGAEVFTRRVDHPGTKPNKYPVRAYLYIREPLKALARKYMGSAARLHVQFYGQLIPEEV